MPLLSKARSNWVVIGGRSRIIRILRTSCLGVIPSKYDTRFWRSFGSDPDTMWRYESRSRANCPHPPAKVKYNVRLQSE